MTDSTRTRSIVLLEDDPVIVQHVERTLTDAGYRVQTTLPDSSTGPFPVPGPQDAVLARLDWKAGHHAGRVRALRRRAGSVPLVLLCDASQVELAVQALRHGADDYMLRPPDPFELRCRLERLLDRDDLDSRITFFQEELNKRGRAKHLEARSPGMRTALERVLRVAPMRSTVLISGESGVGKELVARSIHFNSPRRSGPFMALNCAAISPSLIESELFGHEKGSFTGAHTRVRGKFEIAHRGTLFLDEIAEMSGATQAKLLRVLEEREFMRVGGDHSIKVDVRVIAATNADLELLVSQTVFRQDLYYRLKVVTIPVPPLRERRLDIPALVETFLSELSRANAIQPKTISGEALEALQDYHWPGNVRELKNLLESLLVSVRSSVIGLEDLPLPVRQERLPLEPSELAPGTTLADMERELIRRTLEHTGGNRTHSASLLGIGVRTLQRKIRGYELTIPPTRRRSRRSTSLD